MKFVVIQYDSCFRAARGGLATSLRCSQPDASVARARVPRPHNCGASRLLKTCKSRFLFRSSALLSSLDSAPTGTAVEAAAPTSTSHLQQENFPSPSPSPRVCLSVHVARRERVRCHLSSLAI